MSGALRRLPSMPEADPPSAEERSAAEAAYVRAMLEKRRPVPVVVDERGGGKRKSLAARRVVHVPVQARRRPAAVVHDLRSAGRSGRTSSSAPGRDVVVTPDMVGNTYAVHDGERLVAVRVTGDLVGHRLAEVARSSRRPAVGRRRRR